MIGGDCVYCAGSFEKIKAHCDDGIPVVSHVGLIPSKCTWTGGYKAVGKSAGSAVQFWELVKKLETIGCFGAVLKVVLDRVAAEITKRTDMIMLGMGAGPHADAQYLFAEDVLGQTKFRKPRHAKTYRDFAAENRRLQCQRIAAFGEFVADVRSGGYPAPEHIVPIEDSEFQEFMNRVDG